jgi:hypothetical protein
MKLARSCEDLLSPPHPRPASKWAISPRTVQSHFVTHPAPPLPGIWAAPTSRLRRLGRAQPPQDYLEAKRAAGYYPEANPAAARPWGGEAGRRLLLERWQAGEREGRGPLRLWSRALAPARAPLWTTMPPSSPRSWRRGSRLTPWSRRARPASWVPARRRNHWPPTTDHFRKLD